MTFNKFMDLLQTKYPEASACMHGKFGGTEKNKKVEINFTPNGKCYCYYGSYQDILLRLGIEAYYQSQVEYSKKKLERLRFEHGKENPYSLFEHQVYDNSEQIAEEEKFLQDVEAGKFIII